MRLYKKAAAVLLAVAQAAVPVWFPTVLTTATLRL